MVCGTGGGRGGLVLGLTTGQDTTYAAESE